MNSIEIIKVSIICYHQYVQFIKKFIKIYKKLYNISE